MSVLVLTDVHRTHGSGEAAVPALRGVSLTIEPGELVAVTGRSGSGRSTLLNIPGGLDRIQVPWQLLLTAVVVPVVAMLGAGLLTRSRLPIERRLT